MADSNKLATKKVSKLLLELAIPAVCAQIVTLMYNLVDKIYIGRMDGGALAMAGVGICAPIVTVINAFTGLFGRGGSPLAAISMGEGNDKDAEKYLGNSFCMLLISSVLITVGTLCFMDPLLNLFGASDVTLPYARSYLTIYIIGTVFIQLTVGMNYYITTQGFAKVAMVTTMIGGILNIILDPIFIFAMNMGIAGAALATIISQFVSFVWVMKFLFGKKTRLRIRVSNLIPDARILKKILVLGLSPFFMSSTEGILHICFNRQVLYFGGDIAVSAMTILFSYMQFLLLPCEGVSQGSQPIINYNYGAKNFGRVKDTFKLAVKVNTIITLVYSIVLFGMGISGAALATVISQAGAFVWILIFFFGKKTKLRVRKKYIIPQWKILKQIMVLGAAPFFMSISEGFLEISFNNQVLRYGGETAVSAMTILFSYFQFLLLPCDGIAQGAQPIISYNYGAENYGRSREAIKLALKINTAVTLIYTIVILAFPAFFISIFNDNEELVEVGTKMIRVYMILAFLHGPNSTFQNTYNALGVGTRSFFFAFLRKIILLIPLLYIMPKLLPWGLMAVMAAEPIADSITTVSNFFSFRGFIKKKLPTEK